MAYYTVGYKTATAGTEITAFCPPNGDKIPVLRGFSYTAAGTEHQLYFMSALGVTTTTAFAAAGSTSLVLAKNDPGQSSAAVDEDLASGSPGDFIAYQTQFGDYEVREVTGLSGSTVTIAATTSDVNDGAKVFAFYEIGRFSTKQFRLPASTTRTFDNLMVMGGIPHQDGVQISVSGSGMPALVVVDNITAAGKLDYCSFEWVPASEAFSK